MLQNRGPWRNYKNPYPSKRAISGLPKQRDILLLSLAILRLSFPCLLQGDGKEVGLQKSWEHSELISELIAFL